MFTGIVQGIATVQTIQDQPGLRTFTLAFPEGFAKGLEIGASVACDGVCLTVTALKGLNAADFDVMQQSLNLTTLAGLKQGSALNVERAAKEGAEIALTYQNEKLKERVQKLADELGAKIVLPCDVVDDGVSPDMIQRVLERHVARRGCTVPDEVGLGVDAHAACPHSPGAALSTGCAAMGTGSCRSLPGR